MRLKILNLSLKLSLLIILLSLLGVGCSKDNEINTPSIDLSKTDTPFLQPTIKKTCILSGTVTSISFSGLEGVQATVPAVGTALSSSLKRTPASPFISCSLISMNDHTGYKTFSNWKKS